MRGPGGRVEGRADGHFRHAVAVPIADSGERRAEADRLRSARRDEIEQLRAVSAGEHADTLGGADDTDQEVADAIAVQIAGRAERSAKARVAGPRRDELPLEPART